MIENEPEYVSTRLRSERASNRWRSTATWSSAAGTLTLLGSNREPIASAPLCAVSAGQGPVHPRSDAAADFERGEIQRLPRLGREGRHVRAAGGRQAGEERGRDAGQAHRAGAAGRGKSYPRVVIAHSRDRGLGALPSSLQPGCPGLEAGEEWRPARRPGFPLLGATLGPSGPGLGPDQPYPPASHSASLPGSPGELTDVGIRSCSTAAAISYSAS